MDACALAVYTGSLVCSKSHICSRNKTRLQWVMSEQANCEQLRKLTTCSCPWKDPVANCLSDILLAPNVPHLKRAGFSISWILWRLLFCSSNTYNDVCPCMPCTSHKYALQSVIKALQTCRHPVLRAYSPNATNLAVLGIHLHMSESLKLLA